MTLVEMRALVARLRRRAMYSATAAQRAAGKRSLLRWRGRLARAEGMVVDWRSLQYVCPWLSDERARGVAGALGPAFHEYAITTPVRAAAAVAQFAHESAGFRTTTEYGTGWAYEGRRDLGNAHAGDGPRFKGRGYIQITGRANYAAASTALGHDFLARPEDLARAEWAALASCWWWDAHGCSKLADRGDFTALTRRINGGVRGLADREALHARARRVARHLTPR